MITELPEIARAWPKLSEAAALQQALTKVNAKAYLWQNAHEEELLKARKKDPNASYYPTGKLVIIATEKDKFELAWHFEINAENIELSQEIFINATTGQKIKSYPLFHNCNAGTVASTWYGTQNINTDKNEETTIE